MIKSELVIPKTWRSELGLVALYFVLGFICVVLSREYPGTVIVGPLFRIGSWVFILHLPLLWFFPFTAFVVMSVRIYNVRYVIDARGIEARVGILSFKQRITRVRYEDVRSVETDQSLLDRVLDIGNLEVSTAATGMIEIVLEGIASPKEVQDMLQRERETRQRAQRQNGPEKKMFQEGASV